jgi:type II secretory pathway component PulC
LVARWGSCSLGITAASARILPVFESGEMVGIRVTRIRGGSRWQSLGLRDDDLITEVAGITLDSPTSSVELFEMLASGRPLSLKRDSANHVQILDATQRD